LSSFNGIPVKRRFSFTYPLGAETVVTNSNGSNSFYYYYHFIIDSGFKTNVIEGTY